MWLRSVWTERLLEVVGVTWTRVVLLALLYSFWHRSRFLAPFRFILNPGSRSIAGIIRTSIKPILSPRPPQLRPARCWPATMLRRSRQVLLFCRLFFFR